MHLSQQRIFVYNVTCTLVSVMVCVSHDFLWRKSVEDVICVTSDMHADGTADRTSGNMVIQVMSSLCVRQVRSWALHVHAHNS